MIVVSVSSSIVMSSWQVALHTACFSQPVPVACLKLDVFHGDKIMGGMPDMFTLAIFNNQYLLDRPRVSIRASSHSYIG